MTRPPSLHSRTAATVIEKFLEKRLVFDEKVDGCRLVSVR